MANLSDRIKVLRLSANMTQEEFGKKFGIVKSTVSLYESGKSTPNDQIKKAICDYFHISLDFLLGRDRDGIDYANYQMDTSEFGFDFKMRLKDILSDLKISEDDFARLLNLNKEEKDAYLYGNRIPSIEELIRIAGTLDVSADYLLGMTERKNLSSDETELLHLYNRCDDECKKYLIAKAGVLCVEGISAVAAGEYGKYVDDEKKSFPSSGTEGKRA